jgi:hypothetical protein
MAAKWADYLISAVQYNEKETHIVKVLAHVDNGDTVGAGVEMTRQKVVTLLDGGTTFKTIYKGSDGKWKEGAEVRVVTIEGEKYIRTDATRPRRTTSAACRGSRA